jgi:2-succinyl-5-enolpyruvyl-6-hydroxy-3-cyclohexene-1-carboxylate synthase
VTTTPSAATAWATEFLAEAIRHGLRHLVVSPGSRSQAIALAAMAFNDADHVPFQVHVAIDERSAGFFALGLATETGVPVGLLCTSGSAVGHYLPAVMEAHHSGTGLVVITADRPEELQGVGANQTTTQAGIYGGFTRVVFDVDAPEGALGGRASEEADQAKDIARCAVEEAAGLTGFRPGPVQINVSFRDPLSSAHPVVDVAEPRDLEPWSPARLSEPRALVLDPAPGTVVVAGHGAGAKAEALARDLGAPLFAEVHSGAHFGPHLVVAYRDLLQDPPADITRAVCVGRPTLSREVWALLSRVDIDQVVWQQGEPEPTHPSGVAAVADLVSVSSPADDKTARAWSGPWVMASRKRTEEDVATLDAPPPNWEANVSEDMATRSRFAREELAVFKRPVTRRSIAQGVWEATWPHDRLVVASSRMIRELDKVAPGKNIPVLSTRGLSGIDGQIAFSRGVSAGIADPGTGTVRVILGDIAFLHDVGSLLRDVGEEHWGRVHLFVVVDGGGSIFDTLEAKTTSDPDHFERVLFTPAQAKVSALAEAYGWEYMDLTQFGQMPEALAHTSSHLIVECRVVR